MLGGGTPGRKPLTMPMNRFSGGRWGRTPRSTCRSGGRPSARHAPLVPRRSRGRRSPSPSGTPRQARWRSACLPSTAPPSWPAGPGATWPLCTPSPRRGRRGSPGPYPVEARRGVGRPRPDEPVELVLEAGEDGGLRPRPGPAVHAAEALLPQRPGPAARQPGQPLELGQVHRPGVEAPDARSWPMSARALSIICCRPPFSLPFTSIFLLTAGVSATTSLGAGHGSGGHFAATGNG